MKRVWSTLSTNKNRLLCKRYSKKHYIVKTLLESKDSSLDSFLTNFIFNVETNQLVLIKNDKIRLKANEILIYVILTMTMNPELYENTFMFSTFVKQTAEKINEPISSYIYSYPLDTNLVWQRKSETVSRFDILYVPSEEILLANRLDPECFEINDIRKRIILSIKNRITMSTFNFNPNVKLFMQKTMMNLLQDAYHNLEKEDKHV